MLYPEINKIIDFSNGNQYLADENSSALRIALSGFLTQENVTFNSFGDTFIYGKEAYGNSLLESFEELAKFFLWFGRSWIKLATFDEETFYYASPILKRGTFRSKWDASLYTFQKQKPNQMRMSQGEEFIWVSYPHKMQEYQKADYNIWTQKSVDIYGPTPHQTLKDRTKCWYVETPGDLDAHF